MQFIDSHAHLNDPAFDTDRESLITQTLPAAQIALSVEIGCAPDEWNPALELTALHPQIVRAVLGVHPEYAIKTKKEHLVQLKELLPHKDCVAVGEIGLDYYWDEPDREIQKRWFVRQIDLARELHKPMIIHSRDAAQDTVDIMTAEKCGEIGGVIHCYSYTKETARIFLDMGFYFGIGGVLTCQNARTESYWRPTALIWRRYPTGARETAHCIFRAS